MFVLFFPCLHHRERRRPRIISITYWSVVRDPLLWAKYRLEVLLSGILLRCCDRTLGIVYICGDLYPGHMEFCPCDLSGRVRVWGTWGFFWEFFQSFVKFFRRQRRWFCGPSGHFWRRWRGSPGHEKSQLFFYQAREGRNGRRLRPSCIPSYVWGYPHRCV